MPGGGPFRSLRRLLWERVPRIDMEAVQGEVLTRARVTEGFFSAGITTSYFALLHYPLWFLGNTAITDHVFIWGVDGLSSLYVPWWSSSVPFVGYWVTLVVQFASVVQYFRGRVLPWARAVLVTSLLYGTAAVLAGHFVRGGRTEAIIPHVGLLLLGLVFILCAAEFVFLRSQRRGHGLAEQRMRSKGPFQQGEVPERE